METRVFCNVLWAYIMGAALGNEFIILQEIPFEPIVCYITYENYVRRETDFKSDKFLLDSTMGFGNLHTFKCLFLVYLCTKMFANWSWKSKVFQNWDRLYKIAIEFWNSTFLQVSKKLLTNNTRPKNISWNYI